MMSGVRVDAGSISHSVVGGEEKAAYGQTGEVRYVGTGHNGA